MSGALWVQKALQTADPAEADRFLLEAVHADPDQGQAYGLRARLAVMRGDAVAAAWHFRVAFARGDRSPETRAGLSICLTVAGQLELAERIREGVPTPPSLTDLETLAEPALHAIRSTLAQPLPPRGQPALLPGEGPPVKADEAQAPRMTAEQVTAARGPLPPLPSLPSMPRIRPAVTLPPEPPPPAGDDDEPVARVVVERRPTVPPGAVSVPPPAAPPPSPSPAAAITVPPLPPPPVTPAPAPAGPVLLRRRLPDWVEQIDHTPAAGPDAPSTVDWLDDALPEIAPSALSGAIEISAPEENLVITNDPGAPSVGFRSPVTGRTVRPDEVARQRAEARMPEMVAPPDLLGRAPVFADLVDTRKLAIALELPGPVLTAPGVAPRPLCRVMAFGVTADELFFRDAERLDVPPVRLPCKSVVRMDVVNDDQQLSFVLADGRQLHLDLRGLARLHGATVRRLVRRLEEVLGLHETHG